MKEANHNLNLTMNIEKIKALGNKERLKILDILNKNGPMSWTQIQGSLHINPNSLNFHLTRLLHSEFISREVIENEKGHPGTKYSILQEGLKQYSMFSKLENK